MKTVELARRIVGEIEETLGRIDEAVTERLCHEILAARRLFVHGLGRGGLVMRGFAMRLMHLGFDVHVIGDMTTPPIGAGDLLLINCSKGYVATMEALLNIAQPAGGRVAMFTAQPSALLPQRSDLVITVPAQTMVDAEGSRSIQPMGSVYEQSLWVLCDALVMQLQAARGETLETMRSRHTNLE
jgi:6-phospho-3-hexuloisomerase